MLPLLSRQKVIGIVGGMGPMSGVLLQKLIIDLTSANTDQKHFPVLTFTNPQIPDRTKSLFGPLRGHDFVIAIQDTINALAQAGATVIGIPCNTAHAKYFEIQGGVEIPIVNMISKTVQFLERKKIERVGLLATNGTIETEIYNKASQNIEWLTPNKRDQEAVMKIIYETKAGLYVDKKIILNICEHLTSKGIDRIVLGCTEISLFYETISAYFSVVDSLRILAQSLIDYSTLLNQAISLPINTHKNCFQKNHKKVEKIS